jgi:DNA-binding transcriptional ArsR family regulator
MLRSSRISVVSGAIFFSVRPVAFRQSLLFRIFRASPTAPVAFLVTRPTISPTSSSNGQRPAGETSEARIAKALAHPLRACILQRLGERVASPGDLAVELGAPLGVVSYHVRMLRDYDCVELVRTEPRRGALQHFYKATARPNLDEGQWRTLPSGLRRELAGETIAELVNDLGTAADAGKLEDPDVVLTRTPLELDAKGFKKLNKLMAKTLEQALAIAAESSTRRNEGASAEVFPTELGLLHFKRAED